MLPVWHSAREIPAMSRYLCHDTMFCPNVKEGREGEKRLFFRFHL